MDNINLLYVTLTRAEQQLYIISKSPSVVKEDGIKNYNQFFSEFLRLKGLWNDTQEVFEIGKFQNNSNKKTPARTKTLSPYYYSSPPEDHQLYVATKEASLWNTEAEKAISSGTLLHDTMEKIKSTNDLVSVFEEVENRSDLNSDEKEELKRTVTSIVNHSELKRYFNPSENVIMERKIITSEGVILIPDRLNFYENNSVSVIDYKTGSFNKKHEKQLNSYGKALSEMGYSISEKTLIYTTSEGIVINKV